MRRPIVLVVTSLAAVVVIALVFLMVNAAHAGSTTLAAQPWTLTRLVVNGQDTPLDAAHPITMRFDTQNNSISGSSGCNSYGASYVMTGAKIRFESLRTTLIACENGAVMDREFAYTDALSRVASYQLDGAILTFRDATGQTLLVFQPSASAAQ